MAKRALAAWTAPLALVGCGSSSSDRDLPSDPPTRVTQVTQGGFESPTDAVASPDGSTFYFAAYDAEKVPTIYKVASAPGSTPEVLAASEPLENPIGLVLSCDGSTLYIADIGGENGAILSLSTSGGVASDMGATGIVRPASLAMRADCKTIHAAGKTEDGVAALFAMSTDGGSASIIYKGDPLVSPTGMYVDADGVTWLLDHRASADGGEGVLWAIPQDGSSISAVAGGLRLGTTGGCSLTAGGGTAVIPTTAADGSSQLTSINIATGEMQQLATPDIQDPSGLRTARAAGVFAVVDSEAGAIYRAE